MTMLLLLNIFFRFSSYVKKMLKTLWFPKVENPGDSWNYKLLFALEVNKII